MKPKYSRQQFPGFTHRFKVEFVTKDAHFPTLDIYSNSDSYSELESFIDENKSVKVQAFQIIHRASREQDEIAAKLIDEVLGNI